jgi:hypothetical protein
MLRKRKSDIVSAMKEKGVKDGDWINDFLEDVNLEGEDFDVESRVERYVKIYNKSQSKVNPNLSPDDPSGNHGDDSKRIKNKIEAAKEYAKQQGLIG